MTARTARWVGGVGALMLGAVALDVFPPVGLLETAAAIAVLITHRPGAAFVAVFPTSLILSSALQVMVTVSGPGNPIMWPIAVAAVLTVVALIRGAAATNTARPLLR
jgi:hypothetical protein